ncbi:hypothetical protein CHL67_10605 [Prosthecochloris sp. GSB1]|uniref:ComF family protein n=1 Tax=Prosthecochloris sp. GSB1 TaxID=281093 RepID=UPI000B8D0A5A|nr:ComF family protein [Prosthecochloris sp. GSB1]ASQ91302.1 hypothetical protein CHL67_10605 [Prosthecochloris sp. GSB1]
MFQGLLNLLYPRVCAGCHCLLEDRDREICSRCEGSFDRFSTCGASSDAVREALGRSRSERTPLAAAFALYRFHRNDVLRTVLHQMKYEGVYRLGEFFGARLGDFVAQGGVGDTGVAVVPVPLHRLKKIERTYNQSEVIARAAASVLRLPVRDDLVVRRRYTLSQAGLTPVERRRNVLGAFASSGKTVPESVLLIDDVMTTGSTVAAVMDALETAGVSRISLAVVALATA